MQSNTTARFYTEEEIREALGRLIRLGMAPDRAAVVICQAFPEFRDQLLH